MTAAERIMKKKSIIKAEMDRAMPKAHSDELWRAATDKLDSILLHYAALPKGVHMHTDSRIFPSAAIYLTVKGVFGQREAYSIIENVAARGCKGIADKLARLIRIPGMHGLFIRMWDPLTRRMFSTNSGFQNVFYPKEKGSYATTAGQATQRNKQSRVAQPQEAGRKVPYVQDRTDQGHAEEDGRTKCSAHRQTDGCGAFSAGRVCDGRVEERREGRSPRLRHVRCEDAPCASGTQSFHG